MIQKCLLFKNKATTTTEKLVKPFSSSRQIPRWSVLSVMYPDCTLGSDLITTH